MDLREHYQKLRELNETLINLLANSKISLDDESRAAIARAIMISQELQSQGLQKVGQSSPEMAGPRKLERPLSLALHGRLLQKSRTGSYVFEYREDGVRMIRPRNSAKGEINSVTFRNEELKSFAQKIANIDFDRAGTVYQIARSLGIRPDYKFRLFFTWLESLGAVKVYLGKVTIVNRNKFDSLIRELMSKG
jgi:hypothetical protein